jgi:hypothetical protein
MDPLKSGIYISVHIFAIFHNYFFLHLANELVTWKSIHYYPQPRISPPGSMQKKEIMIHF